MKINRVQLKNYRTHEELEVEFSEGINLLLGSNGAGKTSVLEAIGITMFDASNRSTVKESIKNGEKNATVNVDFTGNDGLDYIVERKMGTVTRHRIYEKNNPENEIAGKNEVVAKVTELCGIKKNSSKIYESVVTVRQNEIVNLFMGTNSERESMFNEIFDTEIYRDIYKNYSKEILDMYKQDIEITNAKIEEISGMLIDVDELQKRVSQNLSYKEEKEKKKKEFDEEFKITEEKKEKLEKIQNLIKESNSQSDMKKALLNSFNDQLERNKINLEKAEEAKGIVIEKREAYLEYKENSRKLRIIQERLRELDSLKNEKENLNSDAVKIEKSILSVKNEIDKNNEQIKHINNMIGELEESNKIKNDKLEKVQNNEIEIKKELQEISVIQRDLEEELAKLNNIEKKYIIKNSELIKLKDYIKNYDIKNYDYSYQELKNSQLIFTNQKLEKENLERKKQEKLILLEQNSEASGILGEGICPFLNETCKNIADHSDISSYFTKKEIALSEEIELIKNELKEYALLDISEKKLNKEKNRLELEAETLKNKKDELKSLEKEIENLQLQESNKKYEIRDKIDVKKWAEFTELAEQFKLHELNEKLKEKKITLETNLSNLNIDEQIKEIHKIQFDIKVKKAEILQLEGNAREEKLLINEYGKQLKLISEKLSDITEKLLEYDEVKIKEKNLIEELDKLKEDYENYMAYISTAKTYHELKAENEELHKNITEKNMEIKDLSEKLEDLNKQYNEKEYVELKENLIELKTKIDTVQRELFDIEYQIKDDEKELARFKENKNKIKKLQQENSKLKKKINLTEKFREYVNKIGKNISKQMIEKISLISTENFREITGRSEMLEWKTTEKEAYMLYLVDDKDSRKFTMLSGGEQVAAALAVRAAMASTLSKANFAIFDEPTNNLDEERRKALADSLSKILGGVKQSIIVTHDDTFQEMANKIIRL